MKKVNCCDGVYNSFDIHFTSACDNNCSHCVDKKYDGTGVNKPNVKNITNTIIKNSNGYDDVLFLGGEPCLYLDELEECIDILKDKTSLKLYVTTSVPYNCFQNKEQFFRIINKLDGINLSVQHYKEDIADKIRNTKSKYDRQKFYNSLPYKQKIRINLNIVKPYLYTKEDILNCLKYYDQMNFNSIKLSEIQHGKEFYVSFEKVFGIRLKSAFYHGCQTYIKEVPINTPLLLKRSCFMCEETLSATFLDSLKVINKIFNKPNNKYSVIYEDGKLEKGWV